MESLEARMNRGEVAILSMKTVLEQKADTGFVSNLETRLRLNEIINNNNSDSIRSHSLRIDKLEKDVQELSK